MKMQLERRDIREIQIDTIEFDIDEFSGIGDFDVDVDELTQGDDITIKISGACTIFTHDYDWDAAFKGTLTKDENDFMSEYHYAIEDGKGYVTFDGKVAIKISNDDGIVVDPRDTYEETMDRLSHDVTAIVDAGPDIVYKVTEFVLKASADKIIEEIKRIDNKELSKDNMSEYMDYVTHNVISIYGRLKDSKYKSIDAILLAKIAESDEVDKIANDALDEYIDSTEEEYDVEAKVYISA